MAPLGGRGERGAGPVPQRQSGVRGAPGHLESPLGQPASPGDQGLAVASPFTGFDDQHGAGVLAPLAGRRPRDLAADLLVRDGDQHQVGRRSLAARGQQVERADQHREAALHVEGAGGDQSTVDSSRRDGRQDGVEVTDEQQVALAAFGTAGDEQRLESSVGVVLLADGGRESSALEAARGQAGRDLAQPVGVPGFSDEMARRR